MIILILHGQESIRQNNELSVVKAGTSIIIIIIKNKTYVTPITNRACGINAQSTSFNGCYFLPVF